MKQNRQFVNEKYNMPERGKKNLRRLALIAALTGVFGAGVKGCQEEYEQDKAGYEIPNTSPYDSDNPEEYRPTDDYGNPIHGINESRLRRMIRESISRVLSEGFDTIDSVVEEMNIYLWNDRYGRPYKDVRWLEEALMKKIRRGIEPSVDQLAASSVMDKICRSTLRVIGVNPRDVGKEIKDAFKRRTAETIISDIKEEMNMTDADDVINESIRRAMKKILG